MRKMSFSRRTLLVVCALAAGAGIVVLVIALRLFSGSSGYPDSRDTSRHRNYAFTRVFNARRASNEASGINLACVLGFKDYNYNDSGLVLDDYDLEAIRNAGFRHLRVSVELLRYLGTADGEYHLDPGMLDRLDWILRGILCRDMIAHLDFHSLLPDGKLSFDSEEEGARNEKEFLAVWTILSERYKGWPAGLCFELANEPHKPVTPQVWNRYVREALALIRSSGGANATRPVIVATNELVPWNQVEGIRQLQLPSVEEDPNILVTFHYYQPPQFTWQGETFTPDLEKWSGRWLGNTWDNTDRQKAMIRRDFDMVAEWGRKNRRRIILGEFGVTQHADIVSAVNYTRFVREEAEARGMIWLVWQLFDSGTIGGLFDESVGCWRRELLDALMPESQWGIEREAERAPAAAGEMREIRTSIAGLRDVDPRVRRNAAHALRSVRREAAGAIPALAVALRDEEWQVRQASARALAAVMPAAGRDAPRAVPALVEALGDPEWWVRKAAAQALSALGPLARPAVPKLVGLLKDEEWLVRKAAVVALACAAPDDPPAREAVRSMLRDPEDQVRAAARRFLRTLADE